MKFTDIFVRRPVLATVISLAILVLGLRAAGSLPVQQYPSTENAVVTVTTAYFGADPETISGFITTPLETAIAQVNGIDYMTSSSSSGLSTITINLRLNWDADKALTEIDTKVNSVRNQLPPDAQQPVLNVAVGQTIDAMYIGFDSAVLAPNQITDYLVRVVRPSSRRFRASRPPSCSAPRTSPCVPGSIRASFPPTASRRPMSHRHSRPTTTLPASAKPRARWCRSHSTPRPTCIRWRNSATWS